MNSDLIQKLRVDYPDFLFKSGTRFAFRPPRTIVLGDPNEASYPLLLLHEVGHALCGHRDFKTTPQRVKMEREAWEKARELCDLYGVEYDEAVVEQELDSYRDWLDKKSRCPVCGLTRFQTTDGKFHCPKCENFDD